MRALLLALLLLFASLPALAVNPDEVLADPALEARARAISAQLRCLVCQNQSIDDSDADLARELRLIVRERLTAGDTDRQAMQYIVDRYGEFVLLNPVVAPHTILLWIAAPAVLLIGGIAVLVGAGRRRRVATAAAELSPEEQAALRELDAPEDPRLSGRFSE
ncbi:MAG TPA: cytochrome c-type biogenesis protein CcmH [Alphaproteobacteria bacterium]|nr:cytochrome c-type biogenesis protein CcmH [Alphaproteobacteria bacterium]